MDGMTFGLSILASVIASIIWVLVLNLFSTKFRVILYGIAQILLKTDLEYVYKDSGSAAVYITKKMQKSGKIYIYTGRGHFLQEEEYATVFDKDSTDVRIVLPLPDPDNKWLKQRADEMNAINKGFTNNSLARDISGIAEFLKPRVDEGKIKLQFSNSQHIGKIIILDSCAFFVPYQRDKFGKDTKLYVYPGGSYMYNWLERYFNALWKEDAKI